MIGGLIPIGGFAIRGPTSSKFLAAGKNVNIPIKRLTFCSLVEECMILLNLQKSQQNISRKNSFLYLVTEVSTYNFGHLLSSVESEETPVVVGGKRESNLWKLV